MDSQHSSLPGVGGIGVQHVKSEVKFSSKGKETEKGKRGSRSNLSGTHPVNWEPETVWDWGEDRAGGKPASLVPLAGGASGGRGGLGTVPGLPRPCRSLPEGRRKECSDTPGSPCPSPCRPESQPSLPGHRRSTCSRSRPPFFPPLLTSPMD